MREKSNSRTTSDTRIIIPVVCEKLSRLSANFQLKSDERFPTWNIMKHTTSDKILFIFNFIYFFSNSKDAAVIMLHLAMLHCKKQDEKDAQHPGGRVVIYYSVFTLEAISSVSA